MAVSESGNSVLICPICGKPLNEAQWLMYECTNRCYCPDDSKEIIPLATPQEVR